MLQTLAGALPIERDRLDAYLQKALREGKVTSNWLTPDEEHERAVQEYAARAAALIESDPFLDEVRALGRRIAAAQVLLKLTAPGVPGHLPRRRARGSLARRPGQPPAGRLGRAP